MGTLSLMMNYLILISASLGAAAVAYVGNRAGYGALGARAAVAIVPWWEEACKLAAASAVPGLPMLWVHLVFGALEFGYDLWRGHDDAFFLGLLSFCGHGLFGGVAMLAAVEFGSTWWTYLAAGAVHAVYNAAVLYLVLPTLGAGAAAGPHRR